MPDYQKGKIYKLHILGNSELVYYGSTIQTISRRIAEHRRAFKSWKNGKSRYTTSYKLLEKENVVITLVENYPCNSKFELEARERYYIENNKCVNKVLPTRTSKEYEEKRRNTQKRKQYMQKYSKTYRERNGEKLKKKQKEYYEANKEEIKQRVKEYTNNNSEKIKKNQKEYNKIKTKCPHCNSVVIKHQLKRHQQSIKCLKIQQSKQ